MGWLLSLLGINPLGKIIDGLNEAFRVKENATTDLARIAADERIKFYQGAFDDLKNARASAKDYPWWLAGPMAFIALTMSAHVSAIALGTVTAPLIQGTWLGAWLLHIPELPGLYPQTEAVVVGFFFGGGTIVAVASRVMKGLQK